MDYEIVRRSKALENPHQHDVVYREFLCLHNLFSTRIPHSLIKNPLILLKQLISLVLLYTNIEYKEELLCIMYLNLSFYFLLPFYNYTSMYM